MSASSGKHVGLIGCGIFGFGVVGYYLEKNHDLLGTQSFDMHLAKLLREGKVSREVALEASTNRSDFERALAFE